MDSRSAVIYDIEEAMNNDENPYEKGAWKDGQFYPYKNQAHMGSTEAEQAARQQQATARGLSDDKRGTALVGWRGALGLSDEDRKLLVFAAKAAGIKLARPQDYDDRFRNVTGMGPEGNLLAAPVWDPLTNDGDALRLAVKLELQLRLRHSENEVSVYGSPDGRTDEGVRGDPYAATRRAITRAAAEIGKAMP
jgi:hypothetical protein